MIPRMHLKYLPIFEELPGPFKALQKSVILLRARKTLLSWSSCLKRREKVKEWKFYTVIHNMYLKNLDNSINTVPYNYLNI